MTKRLRLHNINNKHIAVCSIVLVLLFTTSFISHANSTDLIYRIPITDEVDNGLFKLVERGIAEAEELGADLIVFEIDTYGGYVDPAIKIRDQILKANLPTVTYVGGRAWSAGALVALAGETLVMSEASSIGAAEVRPYSEKQISALRKEFKATAEVRDKNADLAAAMVDADMVIEGITARDKLLTLTAEEALEHNMTDYKVKTRDEMYIALGYSPGRIVTVEMTMAEKAARIITDPYVTTILLTIGILALIAEVLIPGFGVAGTVGLLSLGMVFSSYVYYDVAGWGIMILMLVGLVLLALEVFVIPGFGITGIGGIIAIFTSIYFLFPSFEVAVGAIATILILTIAGIIVLFKVFGSSRLWENISLEESQSREAGYLAQSDRKSLKGKVGKTVTPLRPAGIALVEGERIDVVSEGGFIDKNEEIIVYQIAGNRIVVKKTREE
ncbi:MAG: NfeD family protein [Halanaerobiales bacterium]